MRGQAAKEVVGNLFGSSIDQSLADLGKLAANGGARRIGECSPAIGRCQTHFSVSFGETRHATLTFATQNAAVGSVELREGNLAFESCLHRADLQRGDGNKFRRTGFLDLLASGNAKL